MIRNIFFNILRRGAMGIGIGNFCLILGKLWVNAEATISWKEFAAISFMSFLIAIYTFVFEIERLNYYVLFPIHFVLSFLTSVLVHSYLYKDFDRQLWIRLFPSFALIYLLVWLILFVRKK